jgi:uncharacterized protein (TIGR02145 family)
MIFMKMMNRRYLIILLFLSLMVLTFCEKDEKVVTPPEAAYTVDPENGKTTTTFSFNTSGTTNPGMENPQLFFRWDWDGDGSWDTHFSRNRTYEHRFFTPGSYVAYMEVRNAEGLMDTISRPIEVERGNSAPYPSLIVNPELGHIRTLFTFDASGTYDDEDSLSTLRFRWDWNGDGIYDTDYSEDPTAEHVFPEPDAYRVVVQVTDPYGLTAKTNKLIQISLNNPLLVVDFTWTPQDGTTSDVITLDASACYDPEDPDNPLQYRWDINNDGTFDTDWLDTPYYEHLFNDEGENRIRLQVQDQYGLNKSTSKTINILHSNQPPTATFIMSSEYGNLTSEFYFDANNVRDDEDFFNVLEVRWDFESDGVYDTEYSMTKTATHFYGYSGDIKVTLEVKDTGGLTDTTSQIIHISDGTNPTGYVIDNQNGTMYGTVKIGDQWWLSSNVDATASRSCYRNIADNCETYGGLYTWPVAMGGSTSEKAQGICPQGWHIPTNEEWEELFSFLGDENARAELEPDGSSDFRLLFAGQRSSKGTYEYMGTVTNFWSSSRPSGTNAWSYSFQAGKDQIWKLTLGQSYRISVRCIKN